MVILMTSGDSQERRVLKAEQERAEAVAARFVLYLQLQGFYHRQVI